VDCDERAEPIDGSDVGVRHDSSGAGVAPSLTRINSTFCMKRTKAVSIASLVVSWVILFVVGPIVAWLCLAGSVGIACRLFANRIWEIAPVLTACALFLIGVGLLRFSYLLAARRNQRIGPFVLMLVSVSFVVVGAVCLILPLSGKTVVNPFGASSAGIGLAFIGLLGLREVRLRKAAFQRSVQNQSTDPTLASGTPLAGPESRQP
jgi:hypothetical protein